MSGTMRPFWAPRLHDHRCHQGGDHDVVGGGGQAHAQNQADDRREEQNQHQVAAGDELDELGHDQADAGEGHRSDHDAGRRGGNADADHVAGAVDHARSIRSSKPR
jgi:hypothetical protein